MCCRCGAEPDADGNTVHQQLCAAVHHAWTPAPIDNIGDVAAWWSAPPSAPGFWFVRVPEGFYSAPHSYRPAGGLYNLDERDVASLALWWREGWLSAPLYDRCTSERVPCERCTLQAGHAGDHRAITLRRGGLVSAMMVWQRERVWHFAPTPGRSACGADYPNMATTSMLEHATCPACAEARP